MRGFGWFVVLGAVLASVLASVSACGTGEDPPAATSSTTPPSSAGDGPSSSAASSASSSSGSAAPVDTSTAIFPTADSDVRFTSPDAAATAFAVEYVGMAAPVVGGFQAADSRSGEVEIRTRPDGPPSTVVVRQLSDGNWWVLGSGLENIRLDQPAAGARLTSPTQLTGQALAYEGHVDVELRADGVDAPISTTFVTGGGDVVRPFEGTLTFPAPTQRFGAILLITRSARDGSVAEFVAVRVAF